MFTYAKGRGAIAGLVVIGALLAAASPVGATSQQSEVARTLANATLGTILYASWSDLANPALQSVGLVTAGANSGGTPDSGSPYGDGSWTDAAIAANIVGSTDTLSSEGHHLGRAEMAWPGGVPGCTSGASNCRVVDAVNGGNLIPDEVARRIAQGCVAGQAHTEYVNNVPYTSTCG